VAIVGPSVRVKTTLLHVMGTLERPSSGVVSITGLDAAGSDRELAALRATRTGSSFSSFFLAEHSTALETSPKDALCGVAVSDRPRAAAETLARVGLAERARSVRASSPAASAKGRNRHAPGWERPAIVLATSQRATSTARR